MSPRRLGISAYWFNTVPKDIGNPSKGFKMPAKDGRRERPLVVTDLVLLADLQTQTTDRLVAGSCADAGEAPAQGRSPAGCHRETPQRQRSAIRPRLKGEAGEGPVDVDHEHCVAIGARGEGHHEGCRGE